MQTKQISTIIIIILLALVAFLVLNKPDNRNPVQKIGDAIHELPNGADNAARELKDRTPGEKLKDSVKDATDGKN
jgi:short subunit fatty acids transporter